MRVAQRLFALLAAILASAALALDDKPVIWIDRDVPLAGKRISRILPVTDETGQQIPQTRLEEIQTALADSLRAKAVLVSPDDQPAGRALIAKVSVTSFKPGNAAGRWLGFGAGAAKCSIRVQLLDDPNPVVVAEVIGTRVVDTGGFFTIGMDSRFHKDLAKELADMVADILKDERRKNE